MIGIYKITSPTGNVYIGQSVNIKTRFSRYRKLSCKGQSALYNSLIKHGVENHKFEVLCECDVLELNEKERHYQDLFDSVFNGLNCKLTKTSDKSGYVSKETRIKMSRSAIGRKTSEETKEKLRISMLGRVFSE